MISERHSVHNSYFIIHNSTSVVRLFQNRHRNRFGHGQFFGLHQKQGIVINEPSLTAVNNKTNQILAIGEEAKKMVGRTRPTFQ